MSKRLERVALGFLQELAEVRQCPQVLHENEVQGLARILGDAEEGKFAEQSAEKLLDEMGVLAALELPPGVRAVSFEKMPGAHGVESIVVNCSDGVTRYRNLTPGQGQCTNCSGPLDADADMITEMCTPCWDALMGEDDDDSEVSA